MNGSLYLCTGTGIGMLATIRVECMTTEITAVPTPSCRKRQTPMSSLHCMILLVVQIQIRWVGSRTAKSDWTNERQLGKQTRVSIVFTGYFPGSQTYKTPVVLEEQNPQYRYKVDFVNISAASTLALEVYRRHSMLSNVVGKIPFVKKVTCIWCHIIPGPRHQG